MVSTSWLALSLGAGAATVWANAPDAAHKEATHAEMLNRFLKVIFVPSNPQTLWVKAAT
jgi:hypothetical protein